MIVYLILACCTRTPKHQKEEKEEKKREKGCNKLVTQSGLSWSRSLMDARVGARISALLAAMADDDYAIIVYLTDS